MKYLVPYFFGVSLLVNFPFNAQADSQTAESAAKKATSAGSEASGAADSQSELIVRLGNESNGPDGLFGPYTYGLRGNHRFENSISLEAGYIRLHEPGTPAFNSSLDEAQLTVKLPETTILSQSLILSGTLWQNRMIDMYTNVAGLELTWKTSVELTAGLYSGTASRDDLIRHYQGFQLAVATSLGPVELSAGHINGRIEDGYYRKSAIQISTAAFAATQLPTTFTLGVEDRYFDFGKGNPSSRSDDELIVILGAELHLEKLFINKRAENP